MESYEGSKAQQAHQILNLLQQLTAASRNPHTPGFLFRIVDAGTGEALGNARASQDVANAVQAALESMLSYAEAERPERMSGAAQDALEHPDLVDQVEKVFANVDPVSLLNEVINAPDPERAALAYEDLVTGETDGDL